jgi:hypothetical protein
VFKLTGTGFCTAPFSAFNAKLAIYHGPNPNQDAFGLLGSFTLASSSDGINRARHAPGRRFYTNGISL